MNDYRNMAIRFSGALWSFGGICPECGNEKRKHMEGCKKTFEELKNPRDVEKVFVKAFES